MSDLRAAWFVGLAVVVAELALLALCFWISAAL